MLGDYEDMTSPAHGSEADEVIFVDSEGENPEEEEYPNPTGCPKENR
jgi:hypothetical protein